MKIPTLADFRRVVVKVGSSLLVDARAGRLRESWLASLAADLPISIATSATSWSSPRARSRSGARCSSSPAVRSSSRTARRLPLSVRSRWRGPGPRRCRSHGIIAGQVLVTLGDTEERRRYLNARSTIDTLLRWRAFPVINENDTVATNEIRYGDNDRLAARVATMVSADLLVLLSDVDGLYDAPPDTNAGAQHIPCVSRITPEIEAMAGAAGFGAFARRHADQDRSGADRHQCRHAHGHCLRPRRASVARHRRGRAMHVVSHRGQSGYGAQKMDRGRARAERARSRSTPARWRRCAGARACCPPGSSALKAVLRAATR